MRLLRNVFGGLVALPAILAAVSYALQRGVSVKRSIVIAAPPSEMFLTSTR